MEQLQEYLVTVTINNAKKKLEERYFVLVAKNHDEAERQAYQKYVTYTGFLEVTSVQMFNGLN